MAIFKNDYFIKYLSNYCNFSSEFKGNIEKACFLVGRPAAFNFELCRIGIF